MPRCSSASRTAFKRRSYAAGGKGKALFLSVPAAEQRWV